MIVLPEHKSLCISGPSKYFSYLNSWCHNLAVFDLGERFIDLFSSVKDDYNTYMLSAKTSHKGTIYSIENRSAALSISFGVILIMRFLERSSSA